MNAIVCGGHGLIGRAAINRFIEKGWTANSFDIKRLALEDATDKDVIADSLNFYKPKAIINCIYPEDYLEHIKAFHTVTMIGCEWLAQNGGGTIVNLGSIYGIVGPDHSIYERQSEVKPPSLGYSAAKGAIIAMSRTAAAIYGKHGVRVNVVSPGGVEDKQPEIFKKNYSQKTVLGRMATPKDIANCIVWLCSSRALYITGQNIIVDGGFTIK